ncbi:hypothetical protein [Pseudidiomarina sediminum]|uniref:hypothetical protein n=1 Tax=Pseudidiomarina sediminum TaxID=431675 RepID=UPI001C9656B2|nr:hypothetical protein [Pseudidiomarina sediminum]MBY6064886.1 hypothetical protein [Pseudidiomarina sediminum]
MRTLLTLSAVALALVAATTAHADEKQRSELRKQLEVMNSIFSTTLAQQQGKESRNRMHPERLHYDYLAGQGVVYRLRVDGPSLMIFGERVSFPDVPLPPEFDEHAVMDIEFEVSEALAEAESELAQIEILSDSVEMTESTTVFSGDGEIRIVREVSDDVRESAREMRELRRKERDLKLAERNAEAAESEKVKAELKAVQEELKAREKAYKEAREELKAAREELRDKADERRAKRAEKRAEQVKVYEQTIAQTLCDYGQTLRALPNGEHVSFILEGAGDKENGGSDKIYVFTKRQLQKCDQPSDLLGQAVTYSY